MTHLRWLRVITMQIDSLTVYWLAVAALVLNLFATLVLLYLISHTLTALRRGVLFNVHTGIATFGVEDELVTLHHEDDVHEKLSELTHIMNRRRRQRVRQQHQSEA